MAKIKVLHIITRLDRGGSSINTIETVSRLDPNKFEAFLISGCTNDPDGSIEASLKMKNIRYVFFTDLQREISVWKDIKAYFKLYNFIKRGRFDIVHTHSSKAGILGRWAAKYAGVKRIIHTPHGHIFYGYFGPIQTALFIWLERTTALITDKIITLTNRGKQEHIDFKIAACDKFVTIYSGIDPQAKTVFNSQEKKEQFKEQWHIPQKSFIFGYVGRLDPIKGISYLVDAISRMVRQYPQSHLLLVGDGSERQKLRQKSDALGLNNHISFVGFQKEPDRFIECMDVFVLASLNEGMGRAILEAMAYGKPVIATKVGGVPELVEDGLSGLLVPARDTDAFVAAMIRLIKDRELLQGMGGQAKVRVGDNFSLDKMVRDIEHLYEHCF
ncbi:MAG: glycosyltransferase family 4 protein [Candidatus Omnitrophica bacterium]|nr:glycosyltransferase family 4 protein [Candidatus Omnitrophota bacterium]